MLDFTVLSDYFHLAVYEPGVSHVIFGNNTCYSLKSIFVHVCHSLVKNITRFKNLKELARIHGSCTIYVISMVYELQSRKVLHTPNILPLSQRDHDQDFTKECYLPWNKKLELASSPFKNRSILPTVLNYQFHAELTIIRFWRGL